MLFSSKITCSKKYYSDYLQKPGNKTATGLDIPVAAKMTQKLQ